jgi:hypothetical protein
MERLFEHAKELLNVRGIVSENINEYLRFPSNRIPSNRKYAGGEGVNEGNEKEGRGKEDKEERGTEGSPG